MSELTLVVGNKNYSSWSMRAWLFLRIAGIRFREIRIPLDQPETSQAIARYSPSGRVPVLLDGELRVWESIAICEHAAERHGREGWPADPAARAMARAVAHEMHAGFQALRNEFPMNIRARRRLAASAAADADWHRIGRIWVDCRQQFGQHGPGLCGPLGIVDAMYAPVVMRARTYGVELPPLAAAWAQAIVDHPAVVEWIAAARQETEVVEADEAGEEIH